MQGNSVPICGSKVILQRGIGIDMCNSVGFWACTIVLCSEGTRRTGQPDSCTGQIPKPSLPVDFGAMS